MLLPHCTWDKFGDILAHNGGKLFGLFDELISFFFNNEHVLIVKIKRSR